MTPARALQAKRRIACLRAAEAALQYFRLTSIAFILSLTFHFYSYVFQDLKCSLPVGLGLSETKITSHGFDGAKEGVVEAGQFPSKGKCFFFFFVFLNLKSSDIFLHGQKYNVL